MSDIKIVGLGISTIDILIRLGQMPSWKNPRKMDELYIDGGGPVGTALVAASRLGVKTGFIGTRGNDELGELKMHYLARDGVDTSHMVKRPYPESQLVVVYVKSGSGERIFSFSDKFHSQEVSLHELDRDYVTSADYLHLDGGAELDTSMTAISWMRQSGKCVVLDAGKTSGPLSEKMIKLIKNCDYLICGSGVADSLTGIKDRWSAGKAILDYGPKVVVQTEGARGSFTISPETCFHTPAFKVDVDDTTGAGDVFHGAYLVGLIKGWPLQQISIFASAVAAIKCTQLGGRKGIPTYLEVINFLSKRKIDTSVYS